MVLRRDDLEQKVSSCRTVRYNIINILLIGGTSIISTEICDRSIQLGHNVFIMNRRKRKASINSQAHLIITDVKNEPVCALKEKLRNNFLM